ncbi:RNA polymerase sigma factor [Prevotella sp. 10(H)]|uniref:RNA polymerase sigma factor n=1 Tax=Prevotella sp. 10(H) TaxID=1158294 RepID=UPI00056D9C5D|nr:sigma-70 family RNA polymerase sigma factor [Prevotella sp. 10(H)]
MDKNDDSKLVDLFFTNEELALKLIYEKYFSLIYAFIGKECRSVEDTKDLTQDVFLKLWKTRHNLSNVDSLKNYLFIIARNTFIDYVRRKINQRIFEELTNYSHIELTDYDADDKDLLNELMKYSQEMPEKRLEVFKLRWVEGKSRKEIAEQMGISIVTVDIHIRKALEFLKKKIKDNALLIVLLLFV